MPHLEIEYSDKALTNNILNNPSADIELRVKYNIYIYNDKYLIL